MKTRIILCILGGFALSTNAQDAAANEREHPYKAIPVKNVFRLKSPPRPKPPEPILAPPPPRITLQGITTILERRQVLFKVTLPGKASGPAKEDVYILSEGELSGEIEVLEINERAGTARFRNHGIEQTLALTR